MPRASRLISSAYTGRTLEFDGGEVGVRVDGVQARRVHAAVRRANAQVAVARAGHHVRVREHEAVLAHDEAAPVVPHAEVADDRVPYIEYKSAELRETNRPRGL